MTTLDKAARTGGAPKKAAKAATPKPHQLTAKALGLAQPQEGGSFVRVPQTGELVKQAPEPEAPPADQAAEQGAAATDTNDITGAGNGSQQQGN